MTSESGNPKSTVMSYIEALDRQEYDAAVEFLTDEVRIIGPAGETFAKPKDFISMLRKHSGKYDIKKMFVDDNDVCLLYDFVMPDTKVYMCSWYKVKSGKIEFIRTIFDPKGIAPSD